MAPCNGEARDLVFGTNLGQCGVNLGAGLGGDRTAAAKPAPGRQPRGIGRVAQRGRLFGAPVEVHRRHGREQRLGVGMPGIVEQLAPRRDFDDAPVVHDRHAVGDVFDDGEVVRDEQHRQAELRLQILQEIEDLRLHGDVEGRHRLVANDKLGTQDQRAGDADALELAARQLMGIARLVFAPEADLEEDRLDRRGALGRLEHVLDVERHADRRTDSAPGIETALRILKHELRMPAQSL